MATAPHRPESQAAREGAAASVAGAAAVAGATVAWTLGTVIIKLIDASVLWITFWRFVLALPLALAFLFLRGFRSGMNDLRHVWVGGLLFAVHVLINFAALQITSVAVVTFLVALQPVLVMLVARRAFGERITPLMAGCAALAIAGVGLVIAGGESEGNLNLLGLVLAVVNVILWTGYFLVSKRLRETTLAAPYQGSVLLVGAAFITPIALIFAPADEQVVGIEWLLVALLALVPTTGHLLVNWAHRYVAASVSSLIILTLPVLASIAAALFLDEPFGPLQAIGGAIVLVSTGIVVYRSTRPESLEPDWE